jgi:hypothetical protein
MWYRIELVLEIQADSATEVRETAERVMRSGEKPGIVINRGEPVTLCDETRHKEPAAMEFDAGAQGV